MKCTESLREKNYYKDRIIELVEKIENTEILIKTISFIEAWLE